MAVVGWYAFGKFKPVEDADQLNGMRHRGRPRKNPGRHESQESIRPEKTMECDFQLKGAAAFPDSLDRGTGAGEPIDEGPVVRPKVSTRRVQPVDVNFMEEMRDFMRHSKHVV